MPSHRHVFTSESVTEGHPDKIADQISDSILDAILAEDAKARVACETLVTTGMAVVAGEITTTTYVHIPDIVRGTITSIGYTDANFGFDAQTCAVLTTIDRQSTDIAMRSGWRRCGNPASCPGCVPTARRRSASCTRTGNRSGSTRS